MLQFRTVIQKVWLRVYGGAPRRYDTCPKQESGLLTVVRCGSVEDIGVSCSGQELKACCSGRFAGALVWHTVTDSSEHHLRAPTSSCSLSRLKVGPNNDYDYADSSCIAQGSMYLLAARLSS